MGSGVTALGSSLIKLFQLQGQSIGIPEVAFGVTVGFYRLIAPLNPAAAVAGAPFFFQGIGGGKEEDLGFNILGD